MRELQVRLVSGKRHILNLGTGGGYHLQQLIGEFDAASVDLSEAMLAHSRRLNPGVTHQVGDMRTVRFNETLDAVLVHDAIDYMTTEADLLVVFATARAHLRPGGVLIAALDHYVETFDPPSVNYETNRDGETELTYVGYSTDIDPNDTAVETRFVFFIKRGGELWAEVDSHTRSLFPIAPISLWEL